MATGADVIQVHRGNLVNEINSVSSDLNISAAWTQVTQAEYDALSPPDPDTLYIIVG